MFSLVLISWPGEISDYITGAAEVFVEEGDVIEDKFGENDGNRDIFRPSEELLAEREAEYSNIVVMSFGSGHSVSYDKISKEGIKVKSSLGSIINIFDPNGKNVKKVEVKSELEIILLDELKVGVYEIIEETKEGIELSKDYLLIESFYEISKEDIEKRYDVEEVDLKEKYNIDGEISSKLFESLAKAEIIGKTILSENPSIFRKILKFNRYEESILGSVIKLKKGFLGISFAPINEDLSKTFIKRIDYASGVVFSPDETKLGRFGVYFSDEKEFNNKEISIIDFLIQDGKPNIKLEL